MKRYLILALVGLVFGCLSGFLGIWLDHLSDTSERPSSIVNLSETLPILPSLPGVIAAQIHWDYDWCIDEEWDFCWPITGFNGLFWMIVFPVFSFYLYLAQCLLRDVKSIYQKRKDSLPARFARPDNK